MRLEEQPLLGQAIQLSRAAAPEVTPNRKTSVLWKFVYHPQAPPQFQSEGTATFDSLLAKYRQTIHDPFLLALSVDPDCAHSKSGVSFKMKVWASPPPQFPDSGFVPVLEILELPARRTFLEGNLPYSLVIYGEGSNLYTGKLPWQLRGFNGSNPRWIHDRDLTIFPPAPDDIPVKKIIVGDAMHRFADMARAIRETSIARTVITDRTASIEEDIERFIGPQAAIWRHRMLTGVIKKPKCQLTDDDREQLRFGTMASYKFLERFNPIVVQHFLDAPAAIAS